MLKQAACVLPSALGSCLHQAAAQQAAAAVTAAMLSASYSAAATASASPSSHHIINQPFNTPTWSFAAPCPAHMAPTIFHPKLLILSQAQHGYSSFSTTTNSTTSSSSNSPSSEQQQNPEKAPKETQAAAEAKLTSSSTGSDKAHHHDNQKGKDPEHAGAAGFSKEFVAGKLSQEELWMAGVGGRLKIWARDDPSLKVSSVNATCICYISATCMFYLCFGTLSLL